MDRERAVRKQRPLRPGRSGPAPSGCHTCTHHLHAAHLQRAGRAEVECAAERSGRAHFESLLDGDRDALQALPLQQLEQWQARLRMALEAATDAVVEMRVAVARRAESDAAEAVIREKEAAGVPLATDCPICMERHMDTALDCGHRACGDCAKQLRVCHTCRSPVTLRLRLF